MTWIPAVLAATLAALPLARAEGQTARQSAAAGGTDETVTVAKGARIDFDQCAGDVSVRTWNRDAVRVQSSPAGRSALQVLVRDQVVVIQTSRGRIGTSAELTVPVWIALRLSGVSCFVDVDGVDGAIAVDTVEGDVTLKNIGGAVKAHTVDGAISVENSRGTLDLNTVEDDIVVRNATGSVQAESVDGDVLLEGLKSQEVDVSTVDGDIRFTGAWLPTGRYVLTTHDGNVWLAVPDNPNATLAVRLFDNPDIDSTVPLPKTGPARGRRRTYTFGAGAAQIEVETFDGDLKLRKPSEMGKEK